MTKPIQHKNVSIKLRTLLKLLTNQPTKSSEWARHRQTEAQTFLIGMFAPISMICLVASQDHVSSRIQMWNGCVPLSIIYNITLLFYSFNAVVSVCSSSWFIQSFAHLFIHSFIFHVGACIYTMWVCNFCSSGVVWLLSYLKRRVATAATTVHWWMCVNACAQCACV